MKILVPIDFSDYSINAFNYALALAKEVDADVTTTEQNLAKRDLADSTRAVSPLEIAPDATVIDTTHMDLTDVIAKVIDLAQVYRG